MIVGVGLLCSVNITPKVLLVLEILEMPHLDPNGTEETEPLLGSGIYSALEHLPVAQFAQIPLNGDGSQVPAHGQIQEPSMQEIRPTAGRVGVWIQNGSCWVRTVFPMIAGEVVGSIDLEAGMHAVATTPSIQEQIAIIHGLDGVELTDTEDMVSESDEVSTQDSEEPMMFSPTPSIFFVYEEPRVLVTA
jgi:hypothetical protein